MAAIEKSKLIEKITKSFMAFIENLEQVYGYSTWISLQVIQCYRAM